MPVQAGRVDKDQQQQQQQQHLLLAEEGSVSMWEKCVVMLLSTIVVDKDNRYI
jgi:hypothetical protein